MEVAQPRKQLCVQAVVILKDFQKVLAVYLLVFGVRPAVARLKIGLQKEEL